VKSWRFIDWQNNVFSRNTFLVDVIVFIITNSYGLGLLVCSNAELLLKLRIVENVWQVTLDG
jgi:hypothetical protein